MPLRANRFSLAIRIDISTLNLKRKIKFQFSIVACKQCVQSPALDMLSLRQIESAFNRGLNYGYVPKRYQTNWSIRIALLTNIAGLATQDTHGIGGIDGIGSPRLILQSDDAPFTRANVPRMPFRSALSAKSTESSSSYRCVIFAVFQIIQKTNMEESNTMKRFVDQRRPISWSCCAQLPWTIAVDSTLGKKLETNSIKSGIC